MHRADDNASESRINLTPMLDVVFIMLIFFIVTATFVQEVGLDTGQPSSASDRPVPPDADILVRIAHNNRITIASRDIDVRRLRANLERLHAEKPDAGVVIDAHPESNNDTLVRVMDTSRLVGIARVRFAERT